MLAGLACNHRKYAERSMTRSVTWPRVGVQTPGQLQRKHRRLDRRTLSAEAVVNRMFEGECLHFYHDRRRGPVWWLSAIAPEVPDAVAQLVIQRDDIVAVGDTLFADGFSQTYRYLEETTEKTHD
jgi:hypothetical protein